MLRYSLRLIKSVRRHYCSQNVILKSDPAVEEYIKALKKRLNENDCTEFTSDRVRELKNIFSHRERLIENVKQLDELHREGTDIKDREMCQAADEEKSTCLSEVQQVDTQILDTVLSLDEDRSFSGCIMEIAQGVGGKEAMLFAAELKRMYELFFRRKGWTVEHLSETPDDSGGIKNAALSVEGSGVRQTLYLEGGIHRVQRIPTTERSGRLHTSTVSVAILHQPTQIEIDIPDRDLRIETKRATGAGGQHVNTTDSAVRIVHIPTGTAVECQTERDQHKNKKHAMTRLRALLYEQQLDKMEQQEKSERKAQVGRSNRNEKIRTYNFNQDRVTDHRLGSSSGSVYDIENVMNGGQVLEDLMNKIRISLHKNKVLEEIESIRRKIK